MYMEATAFDFVAIVFCYVWLVNSYVIANIKISKAFKHFENFD